LSILKNAAVFAFFLAMSMDPNHAPSMRTKATIFAPPSTIIMFISVSNCFAFSLAALIAASACSKLIFILFVFVSCWQDSPFHHHYTQLPYMFEQILQLVKDHIGNDPQIAQHIPPEQADAIHQAIAEHVTNTLQSQPIQEPATQSPLGGLVSQFTNSLQSGSPIAAAI